MLENSPQFRSLECNRIPEIPKFSTELSWKFETYLLDWTYKCKVRKLFYFGENLFGEKIASRSRRDSACVDCCVNDIQFLFDLSTVRATNLQSDLISNFISNETRKIEQFFTIILRTSTYKSNAALNVMFPDLLVLNLIKTLLYSGLLL